MASNYLIHERYTRAEYFIKEKIALGYDTNRPNYEVFWKGPYGVILKYLIPSSKTLLLYVVEEYLISPPEQQTDADVTMPGCKHMLLGT